MTNRTLIGDFGGGDMRIRASKPGFDVTAALDRERLAFDSSWSDTAVIYKIGQITTPGATSGVPFVTTVSFGETLPTVPFVFLFRIIGPNTFFMGSTQSDGPQSFQWMVEVTTSYIRLRGFAGTILPAVTVGYVAMRGPL